MAQRFSNGNPAAYQEWFDVLIQKDWGELKNIELLGSAADITGGPATLFDRAASALEIINQIISGCSNVSQAGGLAALSPLGQGVALGVSVVLLVQALRNAIYNPGRLSPVGVLPNNNPQPEPRRTEVVPPIPQPTSTPERIARVRHYSQAINAIRATMRIKPPGEDITFAIWVEYPVTTPYEEAAIQAVTQSFMRPLNGIGGFVEFNVDLSKWTIRQDPNLPDVLNAKIIDLMQGPSREVVMYNIRNGFSLSEPKVNPEFYDWKGDVL